MTIGTCENCKRPRRRLEVMASPIWKRAICESCARYHEATIGPLEFVGDDD